MTSAIDTHSGFRFITVKNIHSVLPSINFMIRHRTRQNSIFALLLALISLATAQIALAEDEPVALSAGVIIALLRQEPGLLLESKKALLKQASEQGRLLEPGELTDEAIYNAVRQDENTRMVITREIEVRHYVQAKPTRQELERGLVVESPPPRSVKDASAGSENKPIASQEEAYWANHELVAEHYSETDGAREAGAAPSSESPADGAPQPAPATPVERERRRRQIVTGEARSNVSPVVEAQPEEEPATQPDEMPELVRTGLARADKMAGALGTRTIPLAPAGSSAPPIPNVAVSSAPPRSEAPLRPEPAGTGAKPAEEAPQHRPSAYADVPALYDLYSQYSSRGAALERFGADVFRNGTGNFDELPMDLPVGPEYVLGPGDGLSVELFGGISQRLQRVVDRTGRLALPEVGSVEVSGRNLGEAQRLVQDVLRTQYRDVQADISLSRLRSVRVYVVGDVERPGAYDVSSLSTPLNALYQAGGPTARGSLRILRHMRGRQLVRQTDVYDLLLHGLRSGVEGLEPGDTILAPPLGAQVTVEGMVRRPAIYELNGETTLAEVLQLAGGVLQSGTLRHIDVERVEAHLRRTMLRLDIPEDNDQETVARALADFQVEDGDRIKISPILPYADRTIYLSGHVVRPGKFAYRDGMKLSDVVKSYSDLLPEPYRRHAEIIRLLPPDYKPAVLAFNLDDALEGGDHDIALKPFDTIRIFGRFDFEDAPSVRVSGEVRHPGDHLTRGATRLRDAIFLAGGVTRDAEMGDAQVFRRRESGEFEVISVNLGRALRGGERDNILLEPKDQLIIHKNPRTIDPASVKIEGEIVRPGKYPLGESLTAAGLVGLAGGLKRGAYTEAADLTRYPRANGNDVAGEHVSLPLARALAGEAASDVLLRDGDVLTVRQIAGWNDLGATIAVGGEVGHAGAYGIKAGERLSSILARAGGFREDAYPYGAVFERAAVREIEERNRTQLLGELEQEGMILRGAPAGENDDKLVKDASLLQWKTTVERLKDMPPSGRLVIHVSKDFKRWANTSADIEIRAGDAIYVPKTPGTIIVEGAVFNPTAVAFRPGKSAGWYLRQAGGASNTGNRKAIFVVRADGSVIGGSGGMFSGSIESAQLFAGDTVVVPEKAYSGTTRWKTAFQLSQVVQAAAIAASVGRTF